MTEEEAKAQVAADVSRETFLKIEAYLAYLQSASREQNLIAASTEQLVWNRHVLDSLQLLNLARSVDHLGPWIDIGTGGGFPGLIAAIASDRPFILLEPRAKRAAFLRQVVEVLELTHRVQIEAKRAEAIKGSIASIISARAVASLDNLLAMAWPFADAETQWLLPKGRSAAAEVAAARVTWQGNFQLVPSITDSGAAIVVATDVRPRKQR